MTLVSNPFFHLNITFNLMSDIITWSINELDRSLSTGAVYTVHWSVSASRPDSGDSTFEASSYGSVSLDFDPSASGFIPYDNLTQSVCIDWTKAALGSEQVASIEAGLSAELDSQEAPTSASGTPWS